MDGAAKVEHHRREDYAIEHQGSEVRFESIGTASALLKHCLSIVLSHEK